MIIKLISVEVKPEVYYRIMEELNGCKYGIYKNALVSIYRNIAGKYFIQTTSPDDIDKIIF